MFDRLLALLDVLLLLWIVQQGERLIKLERDTNLMARERYDERKRWREAKRKSQPRKDETEINATTEILTSASNSTTLSSPSKAGAVEPADDQPPTSPSA